MSIATQAAANSGLKPPYLLRKALGTCEAGGVLHSSFYIAGEPAAAAAPTPGLAGAALTSYAGQLPFNNPPSGNSYLYEFSMWAQDVTGCRSVFIFDRLWHNSGIVVTTTTAQAITSAAWPARDFSGSTNGEGVEVAIEVSTATTNAGAISNTTLDYTNDAGTAGRTATISSFPATAVAGTFVPFQLQAGDTGIRSIQNITLGTSYVTGTIHLVAYRFLDVCPMTAAPGQGTVGAPINNRRALLGGRDMHGSGFVRLYDNTVPFLVAHPANTILNTVYGALQVSQG